MQNSLITTVIKQAWRCHCLNLCIEDNAEHHYSGMRQESQVFGPDVLKNKEQQVQIIRENLKVVQSQQKSYADNRRRELAFEIGDFV